MAEYENQRSKKIEENKRRMEELGVEALAYSVSQFKKPKKKKINKKKPIVTNEVEFVPEDEDGDLQKLNQEHDNHELATITRTLRSSHSKKIMANRVPDFVPKQKSSSMSISSIIKMHTWDGDKQDQQGKGKDVTKKHTPTGHSQKEYSKQDGELFSRAESLKTASTAIARNEESGRNNLANKRQNMVAPGSLKAYAMMIENRRHKAQPTKLAVLEDPMHLRDNLSFEHRMEDLERQKSSALGQQLLKEKGGGMLRLTDEDEDCESLDDCALEEERVPAPKGIHNDIAMSNDESIHIGDHLSDQRVLQKKRKTRGPSLCKNIHGRSIDNRKVIILNDLYQPIGPDKETLDEFSRFLGSLARESGLAPLNMVNLHQVPTKDEIWNYVKTKYMIAEEGKGYVLKSVADLWRNYKCRVKNKHYSPYTNQTDRWNNLPNSIPEDHFAELLKYGT